jgi:hypothetical protein
MRIVQKVANNFSAWIRDTAPIINGKVDRNASLSYTAPTISNPPTQAEVQAIANALAAVVANQQ